MDAGIVRREPFGSNPTVGERGTDTRRRVLDAALEVFGEMAYSEARVEQITEKAGCSRPAFYQYFSSKDDVFWALATELGTEMVDLAEQLGPVSSDADGLAHLTDWVAAFLAMHEAWAPVFDSFFAASRTDEGKVGRSEPVGASTGRALLDAFGAPSTTADKRIVTNLIAVLIRCSFYAEHLPKGLSAKPLVHALAHLFHRVLAGPIDGVNLDRGRRSSRRRIKVPVPPRPAPPEPLRPRGEQTRRRLLDAGAVVLPARGYHDARVDDIVAAVGVSHGTFYRYFESKDDFFRVLAQEASARLIELVDRLDLEASPDELRVWLGDWFDAYEADGGVISTWQDMRTSPELREFSQQVGAWVFTRLEKLLDRRDFGEPQIDATILLALLERAPYSVFALGFSSRDEAIDATLAVIRRGFLGTADH
ncbi:TetR/AcrR family transcriptional regulator [Aquihabitans sp. McL0605]|uniref:TetR/AcrR family transcriptional regulator n=1 Tax=Aquihabitans sp. McL0605 TaxID=3415671 RepID=UPI003CF3A6C4